MNIINGISRANDTITEAISVASSKKEIIGKQVINAILLFIVLLVFGCLDFAKLTFHLDYLLQPSYWGTVFSKGIAGVCVFNIGINIIWETELKKDKILEGAIKLYNRLIKYMDDDFEYFVIHVYNPKEKIKSYISQINNKIYRLNKVSKAKDKLLYSSDLEENKELKLKNRYCIKRHELEQLKSDDFIKKNLDNLKVKYYEVDPTIFSLEIDGSPAVHGVKTKGNVNSGKIKASSNVVIGTVAFSMFLTAIGLELNQEQFTSQMVQFWHYALKCASDTGIILWQTLRGMLKARHIISAELTQPFVGRNKVLKEYYKWRLESQKITESEYRDIISINDEVEVEMTIDELKQLKGNK